MRKICISSFLKKQLLLVLACIIGFSYSIVAQKTVLNALTYTIRFAYPDNKPNNWVNRKENVFSVIRETTPDVFGLQEAIKEQVTDFENGFPGSTRNKSGAR